MQSWVSSQVYLRLESMVLSTTQNVITNTIVLEYISVRNQFAGGVSLKRGIKTFPIFGAKSAENFENDNFVAK